MKRLVKTSALIILTAAMTFGFNAKAYAAESDGGNQTNKEIYFDTSRIDFATECEYYLPENTNSSSQYFVFNDNGQKINSDGSFTFSYSWALQSSSFKPAGSTIRIYATATCAGDDDNRYYINLYKEGESNPVKTVQYTANGNSQYADFSGLDTNSYYYMYFRLPVFSTATITGSGQINYIQ